MYKHGTNSCVFSKNHHINVIFFYHRKWFRPTYTKVSILSSYFPHATIVALTATATLSTQNEIMECLGISQPVIVRVNPDCPNIYFASFSRPSRGDDKLLEILQPLAQELKMKRQDFPLTLIYGNLETISPRTENEKTDFRLTIIYGNLETISECY